MIPILKAYLKYISYSFIGLSFAFASFYLILNVNHYYEIRKTYNFDGVNDLSYQTINKKIDEIVNNVNSFNKSNYRGKLNIGEATSIANKFNTCIETINNNEYISLKDKKEINIKDVYYLREAYENEVASKCLVLQFIYLTEVDDNYHLVKGNKKIYENTIRDLISDTDYLKKDILSNSNYNFSTNTSMLTGKNMTKDSFYRLLKSYDKVATLLLDLSNTYKDLVTEVR